MATSGPPSSLDDPLAGCEPYVMVAMATSASPAAAALVGRAPCMSESSDSNCGRQAAGSVSLGMCDREEM